MPFSRSSFSGYPFDRDSRQEDHLASTLNDLAKRHPELAGHLDDFTQRSSQRSHRLADEPDFHSRFGRPFADRFGFPFDSDDFDPEEVAERFYKPHQDDTSRSSHQEQPATQHKTDSSCQTEDFPSQHPEKPKSHIQQSNTIDLGQKQESVEERKQRSMSAPPGAKSTSSTNIPADEMAHNHQPTERIIPIQIEGRDTPIIPKNTSTSQSQPHQSFRGSDRIFGQRPEQFTQFVHPRQFTDPWHEFSDEPVRKQTFQHDEHPKDIPIPVHKENVTVPQPQHKVSTNQQPEEQSKPAQEAPKPPSQEPKTLSPIDQIQIIQKDVSSLMEQVQQFAGKPRDKQYLFLDEMLTRNLIKLDNIDVQGQESIRSSRKEAIKCIEKAIGILEAKAAMNKEEEKMDVEQPQKEADDGGKVEEKQPEQSGSVAGESAMEVVPEKVESSKVEADESSSKESGGKKAEPEVVQEKSEKPTETKEKVEVAGGSEKVEEAKDSKTDAATVDSSAKESKAEIPEKN